MVLLFNKKKEIIKNNKNIAEKAISVVIADASGITVNKINKLRKDAISINVKLMVIKNTLLKRSLKNTKFSLLNNHIKGSTLIGFSMNHPGSASRLFIQFKQKNNNFTINTGVFENKVLSYEDITELAKMPTYQEAIQKMIFILKDLCLGKLLRVLQAIKK